MGVGIINNFKKTAATTITSSAVLQDVGLNSEIAANQTQHIRAWVPIDVGATGGVRAQLVVPSGGTLFNCTFKLFNTVAPGLTTAAQTSSSIFTNALANAGTHWLEVEATVINGTASGTVSLEMAQNTSDILPLTILRGAVLQAIIC
jgi:hypothetical protein